MKYSTVHDLAVHLGVSDRTIERWHAKGLLPEPACRGQQEAKLWSSEQRKEITAWHLSRKSK